MKGIIAILALMRVLQTAFPFFRLQGLNGTTPPNYISPEHHALATKMNRLSTEVAVLNTRVSALEERVTASILSSKGGFHHSYSARHTGRNDSHCKKHSIRSSHQHPHTFTNPPIPTASLSSCRVLDVQLAPEPRCSPYNSDDFSYPQILESQTVNRMGRRIYIPNTDRIFASTCETDIEHFVAPD